MSAACGCISWRMPPWRLEGARALIEQGKGKLGIARGLARDLLLACVHGGKQRQQRNAPLFRQPGGVLAHAHAPEGADDQGLFHGDLADKLLDGKFQRGHAIRVPPDEDAVFFLKEVTQQRQGLVLTG